MSVDCLATALKYKPHIKLELVNCDLDWQIALSYTYDDVISAPPHLHTQDYYEIIIHLKSGRAFYVDGTILQAGWGDLLIFPPDIAHKSIDLFESPYERYYIFINPELLGYLADGELIKSIWSPERPNLVKFDEPIRNMLLKGFEPLKDICAAERNDSKCIAPELLMDLRIHILRLLGELVKKPSKLPHSETKIPPMLDGILKYIGKNYAVISSMGELAEHFGISESYMSRLFRNWLDTSPYKYIRSVRLIEAKKLMRQGANVTEACFASGFGDCSHFIEMFKSELGITPGEWKRTGESRQD